ncbi:hypothetical protein [Botrimarina mediterranea]|uniref:CorA-like Mg2+ transporter protein n=1 Tax=Botrimarina mediterranea TaxID=2528022 RepID=A0A518K482_9BACT|nr:hypothetical protein [Botrimarina mediterranea]QDV72604.1 CorA-like Mg2+ transporter protein [Botrimarina mediterranea]QDV77176.1 CorA-like Mg2+ transporter protein [Planctomycetes bacterium K2D]
MAKQPTNAQRGHACPLLPAGWEVPAEFRERLGDDVGRQRVMAAEGHLLLVLHAPPKSGEDYRVGRLFWRDRDGRWKPQGLTHNEHAIGELLREYESRVDEIDTLEDEANESSDYFEILTEIGPLIRSANNLLGVLEEARTLAKKDRALILLRDRAYALTRRLDLIQHEAQTTINYLIARRAEEQAEAVRHQTAAAYRLNILAAFFFPVATISAIFGMNLSNGLEVIDARIGPATMALLVGGGLAMGAVLSFIVTRKW